MTSPKTLFTADDLWRLPSDGKRYELVRGELVEMPPAGARHGNVAINLGTLLNAYVRAGDLGKVFAAETAFVLQRHPDTVRAPDAAFVSKERLPSGDLPEGFLEVVPDLVVEVVSPSDTAVDVQRKVEDWLHAGVRLVWVIYPGTRSVAVYRSLADIRLLTEADTLEGDSVLPGFSCLVAELF